MNQIIDRTNAELRRLSSATNERDATAASTALIEQHLPALDGCEDMDSAHMAAAARAAHRSILAERAAAARSRHGGLPPL